MSNSLARGVHHVGLTVIDLDAGRGFFYRVAWLGEGGR